MRAWLRISAGLSVERQWGILEADYWEFRSIKITREVHIWLTKINTSVTSELWINKWTLGSCKRLSSKWKIFAEFLIAQKKFALQISETLKGSYHFSHVFQHCWGLIYVLSLERGKFNGFLIIPRYKEQTEGSPVSRQSRKRIRSDKKQSTQSCPIEVFLGTWHSYILKFIHSFLDSLLGYNVLSHFKNG